MTSVDVGGMHHGRPWSEDLMRKTAEGGPLRFRDKATQRSGPKAPSHCDETMSGPVSGQKGRRGGNSDSELGGRPAGFPSLSSVQGLR